MSRSNTGDVNALQALQPQINTVQRKQRLCRRVVFGGHVLKLEMIRAGDFWTDSTQEEA